MDFIIFKTRISVSPLFFSVLTAILLLDKSGVSGFAILFSFLHEMGHILTLFCIGIKPESVFISVFGIRIKLPGNLSTKDKLLVLMSGFTVNFLLALLFFYLDKTVFSAINFFIGVFTAFPVVSTDGGSILKIILEKNLPQKSERIFKIISNLFTVLISLLFVFISVFTENYFILIAVIYMIFCVIKTAAE